MTTDDKITLFHSPHTRSGAALTLLEELRAPYELHILNMKAGEHRQSAYLALNPLGKVPALLHGKTLVTEQVAIFIYLTDLFPKAGLAPLIGDPLRGSYLRWLVYYAACFEPALVDRSMNRDPAPAAQSPYGDFDTMLKTIVDQVGRGPYLLGRDFSAADLLWGLAFRWSTMFKLVPESPVIADYVKRVTQRPSCVNIAAMDADLIAEHEAAVKRMQGRAGVNAG